MTRPPDFTGEEARGLEDSLRRGDPLECPGCGSPLDLTPVPPRSDVSYVRDRVLLACARCHRTVVLDRRGPS